MTRQGRVKKMTSRGFGFIETDNEVDFFFHYSDYDGNWKELLAKYVAGGIIAVNFEQDLYNTKAPKAIKVVVIDCLWRPPVA